jgi:DNA-binding NarL/FixJ family response regulator
MQEKQINIAIVDDHTLFRNGIAALMGEFEELNVVFDAENGSRMQQVIGRKQQPDVILMDINMPLMDGYAATAWLKQNYPLIKVLALSMFEDDKAVIRMIKSGASGYILKESKPSELMEAIRTVYETGVYLNNMITGKLMRSVMGNSDEPNFTAKETEFLKLCCSELTYKEIADKLFVSPRTVDNYRESLFLKLSIKSRTGLVLYAIKNDIFKP